MFSKSSKSLILTKRFFFDTKINFLKTQQLSFSINLGISQHMQSIYLIRIQIIYRICKESPHLFRELVVIFQRTLFQMSASQSYKMKLQTCLFFTDLFMYGFYFTAKTFLEKIFIVSQKFIIDYVIRLPPINQWQYFMARKYVYKLKSYSQNWINQAIKSAKSQFSQLRQLQQKIQHIIIERKRSKNIAVDENSNIHQSTQVNEIDGKYEALYQKYQNTRQKLIYLQRDEGVQKGKQIQLVKRECEYFQPLFRLPQLLYRLYKERQVDKLQIKRVKKSQITTIFDDEAFLTQLKVCGSIQKAIELSSYFIANLSTQSNRQQLIQFIIDYCHYQSNLDLIMKIISQINCEYKQISEYLNKKTHKIASQIVMNKKYLNLICEGVKFGLIDSEIILGYVQKRLKCNHTQLNVLDTVRQSCSILELLGQGIYHECLSTNIFINSLFQLIEQRIKQKKLGLQFTFNLKCLKNYLRRPHLLPQCTGQSSQSQTLTQLALQDYNLQQHFQLILRRIKQLLLSKPNNKIQQAYNKKRTINYIILSIDNKSSFIQTFYEASLVKQLNHKEIKENIVEKCIEKVQVNINKNIQQALRWSRFLGELYNYQIINRKRLAEILQGKLLFCAQISDQSNFQHMAKCVVQCLNTSKSYIIQSQQSKQNNQFILHFLIKFKKSIVKYLSLKTDNNKVFDNVIIQQQIQDILEYFHPALLSRLKKADEIDVFVQKVKFSSQKDTLLSLNLYEMLKFYGQTQTVEDFDPTLMEDYKNKHIQKQHNGNKPSKKPLYKEKVTMQAHKQQPHINTSTTKQVPVKTIPKKIHTYQQKIQQINQNFRNQQQQALPEQQKQIIKQQGQEMQKQLKKMMGITAQIQINEKFPKLNQRNPKRTRQNAKQQIVNMKKILRSQNGKKMKIIARKRQNKGQTS